MPSHYWSSELEARARAALRVGAALIVLMTPVARAYNSEEHKLLADWAASEVIVDPSVHLPYPTRFASFPLANYLDAYKAAKTLAVGLASNNQSEYDDHKKKVQDNSYWYNYAQRAGNLNIWIPPLDYLRETGLFIVGYTGTEARSFTFGDLVALYGDYRRTTYCPHGNCYLTDAATPTIGFYQGQDCFGVWPFQDCGYRPDPMGGYAYLRDIAAGLWPPYGTIGNTVSNTAGDEDYFEAGWWGDEMIRIANTNDWHFSSAAVAWYVGMHRLALQFVQLARTDTMYWNAALHYEASALHSLSDLFAFGHIVTNRDQTSYGIMDDEGLLNTTAYQWMENSLNMGSGQRDGDGRVNLTGNLPPINDRAHNRNDFLPSYRGVWANWARWEHDYHDQFNNAGALVRNLRGDRFYIYGDAKLRVSSDQTKGIIKDAIRVSLQALFDAYVQLDQGGRTVDDIGSSGSSYFAALRYIPVFEESDPGNYFTGRWMRYASVADVISGSHVVPADWTLCEMPYINGGENLPAPSGTACSIFPAVTAVDDQQQEQLPSSYALEQNFPNPFNPSTSIGYTLPERSQVTVAVFNLLDQRVRTLVDEIKPAGHYQIVWDGHNDAGSPVSSGVYFYRLTSGQFTASKKMLLLK